MRQGLNWGLGPAILNFRSIKLKTGGPRDYVGLEHQGVENTLALSVCKADIEQNDNECFIFSVT